MQSVRIVGQPAVLFQSKLRGAHELPLSRRCSAKGLSFSAVLPYFCGSVVVEGSGVVGGEGALCETGSEVMALSGFSRCS